MVSHTGEPVQQLEALSRRLSLSQTIP